LLSLKTRAWFSYRRAKCIVTLKTRLAPGCAFGAYNMERLTASACCIGVAFLITIPGRMGLYHGWWNYPMFYLSALLLAAGIGLLVADIVVAVKSMR
jgi:hypothetical protein